MKFGRKTIQSMAVTSLVLVMLLSGGAFAYSTRGTLAASTQNTQDQSATTTATQQESSDHGDNEQGNANQKGTNEGSEIHFHLVPVGNAGNPEARGTATIEIHATTLDIEISVGHVGATTTFSVVLEALATTATPSTTSGTTPSCKDSIGTFMTSGREEGEAKFSTRLSPGTYQIGLILCSDSRAVLVSDPLRVMATVSQGQGAQPKTESRTSIQENQGENNNVQTGGQEEEDRIRSAEADKTIPVSVSVSNSGVSFRQFDLQFSVSSSRQDSNGLLISISGKNVSGPRVLLVNLNGDQWTTSYLQSMKVLYDGNPISQAASLSQVLAPSSSDPARYIILVTSSGPKLLVSITHFSLHTVQILPSAASVLNTLAPNALILLAGVLVFTGLSITVYSRRRRFLAILA